MRASSLLAAFTLALASTTALAQGPTTSPASPPAAPPAPSAAPSAAAAPDPVVARVGSDEIHSSDLAEAAQGLPEELRGMPAPVLYPMLLDQMIDRKVIVQAARKAGLERDPQVQKQIARATDTTLQNALLLREVGPQITEDAIRARYERDIAGKLGEEEVRARHILVADEAEAKRILEQIQKGANFEELAKEHSTDPTARAGGGDLGFFKKGDMLPEFAAAVFALKPGEVSPAPVKTRFGWHIIKLEDRRTAPPPPYEQVRDEIRQAMIQEGVKRVLDEARQGVKIERFNPDGSPQAAAATPPAGIGAPPVGTAAPPAGAGTPPAAPAPR